MVRFFNQRCGFHDRAGYRIGAIGGASLATEVEGFGVDILEFVEAYFFRAVDCLGNRAIDKFLRQGLYNEVVGRAQLLCINKIIR